MHGFQDHSQRPALKAGLEWNFGGFKLPPYYRLKIRKAMELKIKRGRCVTILRYRFYSCVPFLANWNVNLNAILKCNFGLINVCAYCVMWDEIQYHTVHRDSKYLSIQTHLIWLINGALPTVLPIQITEAAERYWTHDYFPIQMFFKNTL